jgi:hypothetical protein
MNTFTIIKQKKASADSIDRVPYQIQIDRVPYQNHRNGISRICFSPTFRWALLFPEFLFGPQSRLALQTIKV